MADKVELTAGSSTDDVKAYAEQVANEVAAERAGDKKTDSQIVAEHATAKKPVEKLIPAETNSGSDDTAAVNDQSDESGEQETSWLDDDLKAEAAAYGIEEAELADFASREEFERALRLFDKSALEAGRKAMAESEGKSKDEEKTGRVRGEGGRFEKAEPSDEPPAKRDSRFEITLDKDIYDEGLVDEITRMRDHYDSRLQALEQWFHESNIKAEEQRFDSLVDSLGHADLFGVTDKEDAKQLQRRQDLLVAVKAQQIGLERLGRPTELNESLVNRVARMVFAEELGKKDLKQRTRKISRQSNGRQGGGATRPQDPREDPRAEFDRLYREMERT